MKKKITKNTKILLAAILLLISLDIAYLKLVYAKEKQNPNAFPIIRASELAQHDGNNPELPIYLAYEGYVYDVSAGREDFYGPGEAYHYLVGKDSTELLKLFGGAIIKRKYQIVGAYVP